MDHVGHFQNTDLNNKIMRLSIGALEDGGAKHIRDWEYNNVSIATREGEPPNHTPKVLRKQTKDRCKLTRKGPITKANLQVHVTTPT